MPLFDPVHRSEGVVQVHGRHVGRIPSPTSPSDSHRPHSITSLELAPFLTAWTAPPLRKAWGVASLIAGAVEMPRTMRRRPLGVRCSPGVLPVMPQKTYHSSPRPQTAALPARPASVRPSPH